MNNTDVFNVKSDLKVDGKDYVFFSLPKLEEKGIGSVSGLPFSIKILLEAAVRQFDGISILKEHIEQLASWADVPLKSEIPFKPTRIVLQDFTGVPAVVDLAAIRSTMKRVNGDPEKINPLIPVDLVIDHSVMVDVFGTKDALEQNINIEFERNRERYEFLRWSQTAFNNFRVVPPATGIVHQVNLEYLATIATTKETNGITEVFPDSLVGTDSHTTMINGLGVLGWGVGGIEAEACMLGQPLYFIIPEVVGFKITGKLPPGTTATDFTLTVTQMLRQKGVVGKFVEFYGDGLDNLSLADRATVANMAPEYGATCGIFPVDAETLSYLRLSGRNEHLINLVEQYYKSQNMFRTKDSAEPVFTDTIELDLSTIEPSLAGPKRPQDRIELRNMKKAFNNSLFTSLDKGGFEQKPKYLDKNVDIQNTNGQSRELKTGSVVIAAITSCTNTSNPTVMIGAGIVARKAVEKGLNKLGYVKTSLTPGSKVVTQYLIDTGLMEPLEALGFHVAGYGCATCIGNSGPLPDEVAEAIEQNNLIVASVLSGNRNFEGRIHPLVKANYLASPPLVVAYSLAGTIDIDLTSEPIGYDRTGLPVYLKDIWPAPEEIQEAMKKVTPELFKEQYSNVYNNVRFNNLNIPQGELYDWNKDSTYIQEPPFFIDITKEPDKLQGILGARPIALLDDSVTTDHISPAGNIAENSPAGEYLKSKGISRKDFNSYGSRRGNHEVMMRGTFANVRIRNHLALGTEGGYTTYIPSGEIMSIYDAAMKYRLDKTSLIVMAGKEYGTGSSRDWAAKGTKLLGIKAVIAESFERIHRSNLVGMGVLPLQFTSGDSWKSLGIKGNETFDIPDLSDNIQPGQILTVHATNAKGIKFSFNVIVRLDSLIETDYYRHGGILSYLIRGYLK